MAVTHLAFEIAIPTNDQLLAKEKVPGQYVSWKCYTSITFQNMYNLLSYDITKVAITYLYIEQQVWNFNVSWLIKK